MRQTTRTCEDTSEVLTFNIPGVESNITYSCDPGYALVKQSQATRTCEDTNGGTVTTGTWSGSGLTC